MRKYFISVLFIMLMCISFGLFIAPADRESILEENREVNTIPDVNILDIWIGVFSAGFDEYVNDNIAFRGKLMAASD